MTESRTTDAFELRLIDLVADYTTPAAGRSIDALEVARAAMTSGIRARRTRGRLVPSPSSTGRRRAVWLRALVAAAVVVALAYVVVARPSSSNVAVSPSASGQESPNPEGSGGPVDARLQHPWLRPTVITPAPDTYGSGYLSLLGGGLEYGPEAGPNTSRAIVERVTPDTVVVTATRQTNGCQPDDVGVYRWSLDGKDTVLTLTPTLADACPTRQKAIAGPWVRADLPRQLPTGERLAAGRHTSSMFDPFDDGTSRGRLSYTVPDGWEVLTDERSSFVLHRVGDGNGPPSEMIVGALATPAMVADIPAGSSCAALGDAPDVGRSRNDLVAAIRAHAGVVSSAPRSVTIGGRAGTLLDLRVADSWKGGCVAPDGTTNVGVALLHVAGSSAGPVLGLAPDSPVRLILVDLGSGSSLAIGIPLGGGASGPPESQAAVVMPVIETFEFRPAGT